MDREHRSQRRDVDVGGIGHGATPGRATLVESQPAAEAGSTIPRLELRPSAASTGKRAVSLGAGPDGAGPVTPHAAAGANTAANPDTAHAGAMGTGHGVAAASSTAASSPAHPAGAAAATPVITHTTQDHAPGGAADTRTTVGVGEMINFESSMPGTWRATHAAPGFGRPGHGQRYMWVAPSTPGTAKITFDPGHHQPKVDTEITIVAPRVDYLNPRAQTFPGQGSGVPGVGMTTDITFTPADVSFANVMWWEQPGPASGATGYFRHKRLPFHHPNSQDLQADATNSPGTDDAGFWGFGAPFSTGSFEWSIPTKYKVAGDSGRHLITHVHQRCTMAPDGSMTVSKGSASFTRAP